MTDIKQHKATYNVPSGDEGGFSRVEVLAPYGISVEVLRKSTEDFLAKHPGAMLLSRTWTDR